jgi:hypothetical protein
MPRSLEPTQVVLPIELARGALIGLPNPKAKDAKGKPLPPSYETLRFQYNPETVTRARTGQWERKLDKKAAKAAQDKAKDDATRGGAIKSKSEVVSFKLVFDAAELIMAGGDTTGLVNSLVPGKPVVRGGSKTRGILPELALLERYALGADQLPEPPKKDQEFDLITLDPTEALLVLGPRTFPGVITQMTIVEQRFNTELVPVRAEIDLRFRVLEAASVVVNSDAQAAFEELLKSREVLARDDSYGFVQGKLSDAIGAAIQGRSEGTGFK